MTVQMHTFKANVTAFLFFIRQTQLATREICLHEFFSMFYAKLCKVKGKNAPLPFSFMAYGLKFIQLGRLSILP